MDKRVLVADEQLFYRLTGRGEPVLLVHGFCGDGSVWGDWGEQLATNYQVIIPDLPGYGQSPYSPAAESMESYAETLLALLDRLQIDKVHYMGHSMGGYIGMAFAEQYPERLSSFTLFHSHAFADDSEKQKSREKMTAFVRRNGAAALIYALYETLFLPEWRKANAEQAKQWVNYAQQFADETILANLMAMQQRPDRSSVLKTLKVPVNFIIGRHDESVPYALSLRQSHLPAVAKVNVLNKAAHMAMMEAPEESLKMVQEFFKLIKNFTH